MVLVKKNKMKWLLPLGFYLSILSSFSHAEFDVVGNTYEIQEESLLDKIMNTLKDKQSKGEFEKLQKEMTERSISDIERPKGINLPSAKDETVRYFDPSVSLNRDIKLPDGRVMYPAGTVVNPLKIRPFTKRFIFIDGDKEEQVIYAVNELKKSGYRDKIILVKGSFGDLTRKYKVRFYFDQRMKTGPRERRTLVDAFGVKSLPTLVYQKSQNELFLTIEEVKL
ncbi:hypothetical protein JCM30760_26150 [Thiomicrorhabdus hydrogeniphila]